MLEKKKIDDLIKNLLRSNVRNHTLSLRIVRTDMVGMTLMYKLN